MTVSLTDLYDILSVKLGKEEAKALTTYVEEKVEREIEQKTTHHATKPGLERGFKEQNQSRLNTFIVIVLMILGLYAAIFFKK